MVQLTSVKGAYLKPGTRQKRGFSSYLMIAAGLVFLIVVLTSSTSRNKQGRQNATALRTSNVRGPLNTGQAHQETTVSGEDKSDYADEEALDEAVEDSQANIEDAEEDELARDESQLNSTVIQAGSILRVGMGKILGQYMTDQEVNTMANEVEHRLGDEMTNRLHQRADEITTEQLDVVQSNVAMWEGQGMRPYDIQQQMQQQQPALVHNVHSSIHHVSTQLADSIHARTQEIEKQILEERLSAKLGKTVKLVIVDDEIKGVDDLFEGLHTFGGGSDSGRGYDAYGGGAATSSYNSGSSYQSVNGLYRGNNNNYGSYSGYANGQSSPAYGGYSNSNSYGGSTTTSYDHPVARQPYYDVTDSVPHPNTDAYGNSNPQTQGDGNQLEGNGDDTVKEEDEREELALHEERVDDEFNNGD